MTESAAVSQPRPIHWVCGKCRNECAFQPGKPTPCCQHFSAYPYTREQLRLKRARERELLEWPEYRELRGAAL